MPDEPYVRVNFESLYFVVYFNCFLSVFFDQYYRHQEGVTVPGKRNLRSGGGVSQPPTCMNCTIPS